MSFSICVISIVREYDIWIVENIKIIINRLWYLWCITTNNKPIQVKCVASATKCGFGLETTISHTVYRGWQLFTNDKYWKSFGKLFHITRKLGLVFQLNDCAFPKDLTQYLSRCSPMIELTDFSRWMTQLSLRYSCLAWVSMD